MLLDVGRIGMIADAGNPVTGLRNSQDMQLIMFHGNTHATIAS